MSIKYYPPSILICYPASFGGCVRIPLQKMTNIPMAMVAIWGVRRPACNEDADKKEHPRRKTKGTHSFIDRLYWICLRSTPYTSCLALPSLFPSDFQLSNCWSRASGFLFLDYASVRRTQPQRNPNLSISSHLFCKQLLLPPLSGDCLPWYVGGYMQRIGGISPRWGLG